MAKLQPLKLSDLRTGVDYPVGTQVQERRCLIHVKLTDFSMRSIESLINSDKGAFFSLWFADGGGTISIPGSKEDRKFNFKTSQGDIDGLECVHQAVDQAKQPRLNCWGQIRYKLQVQGTKEVYERAKKLMKETEEQKQKTRTQTINFPHSNSKGGRSKSGGPPGRTGGGRPLVKTSSPFSTPSLSASSHSSSTSVTPSASGNVSGSGSGAGGGSSSSKSSVANGSSSTAGTGNSKSSGGRKSSKPPHTLKERIIHLLAVKPQKRTDVINRLKRETKRGETAMSKSDSLLQEVADIQGDVYYLKQSLYSELHVDDWPFYSEAERQLVKRKHGSSEQNNDSLKRPATVREPPPPKRPKLSYPPSSTPPPPPQTHTLTQNPERHSSPPPPRAITNPPPSSYPHLNMPLLFGMDSSNSANPSNIEMHSSTSRSSSQHSSAPKPQAQFPGSLASSFILGSSSSSSSASTVPVSSAVATYGSQLTDLQPSQTGLGTAQAGFSSSSWTEMFGVEGGTAVPASGHLFGDLVAGNSAEPMEIESAQKRKEKKKKKKNRTKEKLPLTTSATDSQTAAVKEGVVKSEEGKGGDVKVKSEEGKRGDVKVKSEEGKGGDVKVKSESSTTEENGASSTTPSSVDFSLKFPPITSDAQRAEYKRVFNHEYQEYLDLKGQIEVVNNEVTTLSEQMAAVKKGTEEAKVLRRRIREKYTELQQNKKYRTQKIRFQELHSKLGHIKKLVVEYDQSH